MSECAFGEPSHRGSLHEGVLVAPTPVTGALLKGQEEAGEVVSAAMVVVNGIHYLYVAQAAGVIAKVFTNWDWYLLSGIRV